MTNRVVNELRPSPEQMVRLVAEAREGCSVAEATLFRSYYGLLVSVARDHGLNGEDSADVAQRSWIKARTSLHTLRMDNRFVSWISTIARNESLNLLRSHRREMPTSTDRIDMPVSIDLDISLIVREESDCVNAAVARLDDDDKRLIELLFKDEKSYQLISKELRCPVGSIGPTRARMLQRLRKLVKQEMTDCWVSA